MDKYTGIIVAIVVFSTIGIGHVMVRKLNYHFGTKPAPFLFSLGGGLLFYSFLMDSYLYAAVAGMTAITLIWDGVELFRQETRIKKGHAPENPKRPVAK